MAVGQPQVQHQQLAGVACKLHAGIVQQHTVHNCPALALQRIGCGAGNGGVVFKQENVRAHGWRIVRQDGSRTARARRQLG